MAYRAMIHTSTIVLNKTFSLLSVDSMHFSVHYGIKNVHSALLLVNQQIRATVTDRTK